MTVDDLPAELRARLARIMRDMPPAWRVAVVLENPDGSYTVRICDDRGEDCGAMILWP